MGVSVRGGGGLCPVQEGVPVQDAGSVSRKGVCVSGGLCPVRISAQRGLWGSLQRGGSLSRGASVQVVSIRRGPYPGGSLSGKPRTVTCGRYASHWNSFLLWLCFNCN